MVHLDHIAALMVGALAMGAVPQTPATDASVQKPRWVVDFADQRCSLLRDSGDEQRHMMLFRTVPGAGYSELWLTGRQKPPALKGFEDVKVVLRPSNQSFDDSAIAVKLQSQSGLAMTRLDADFVEHFKKSTGVTVTRNGETLGEMNYPLPAKALEILHSCEDDLVKSWGFDPAAIRAMTAAPKSAVPVGRLFSSNDYPDEAVLKEASGSALVRLVIGMNGRVEECHVIESAGVEALDKVTCDIFSKRGRYTPGLGAGGAPMRAMTATRVTWWLDQ